MRFLLSFCLLSLTVANAVADGVRPVALILYPAAPPSPALKYPLLPELRDTVPGNAVTHYRRAIELMKQEAPPEAGWQPTLDKWLTVSLKELPREEVGKFLKQYEAKLAEVEVGARSENCDWGLTEKLRKTGIATLLSDVQKMRAVAVLLKLRIRHELATGHTDKAIGTFRVGFALARHVADQPTLICSLQLRR